MKRTRTRYLDLALSLAIPPMLLAAAVAGQEDSLDRQMKRLVPDAVDCGTVNLSGANRTAVNACVTKHFLADRSFKARYECLSEDSSCSWGLILTKRPGGVAIVSYDSMGCPGSPPSPYCGTQVQYCDDAKLIPMGDHLKVRCIREFEL